MKSAVKKRGSSDSIRRPPARLSWPASVKESSARCKRPLVALDSELWVERFTPSNSSDLCVAPKKVKECKTWLEGAIMLPVRQKLLVLVGTSGGGKSTMIRLLAREMGLNVHSWNESFVVRERGSVLLDQVVSVEHTSALASFEEFLNQCGAGFSSLQLATTSSSPGPQPQHSLRSLILIEDLPNLHGVDMTLRFRNIMSQHLRMSQVPTILVFSDVAEGTFKPADLERLIDPDDLYAPSSLICQIHPVTKPKMKKVLESIAQQQRFLLPASVSEELHMQSRGDLRNAIMTLQVQFTGCKRAALSVGAVKPYDRDQKLSTFHALGKLLYGKHAINEGGQECLAFDPEAILAQSDLGVGGSLRFLEYHSLDFFTDINDIAVAYALFSDAALLLDNPESSYERTELFPDRCASSIAGRAVANSNKHPAANRFRQFSTPKVFDVIRKRRQNEALLSDLAQRLSSSHLAPSTAVGGSHAFVTEMLPAMRTISPDVVNPSVDSFYSIARESMETKARYTGPSKESAMLEVQAKILCEDDIDDFDSDVGEESLKESLKEQKKFSNTNLVSNSRAASKPFSLSQKENHPRLNVKQNWTVQDHEDNPGKDSPEVIVID